MTHLTGCGGQYENDTVHPFCKATKPKFEVLSSSPRTLHSPLVPGTEGLLLGARVPWGILSGKENEER
jgi:hypothetical protein